MPTRRVPGPKSEAEESFRLHLRADRAPAYKREFRFHPKRKWRFDFAWPDLKLAVEIEGLTRDGGRHQRFGGFEADCEKYNTAAVMGWTVLRFTQSMVQSGAAINTTLLALSVRVPPAEPAALE